MKTKERITLRGRTDLKERKTKWSFEFYKEQPSNKPRNNFTAGSAQHGAGRSRLPGMLELSPSLPVSHGQVVVKFITPSPSQK